MILTYRYRVKSLNGLLNKQARAVSFVWNYCNDRQKDSLRFGRKWLSGFDFGYLTAGSSKELGILSKTISAVCKQYARSRDQHKRPFLRYRGKKSLGWIPVSGSSLKLTSEGFQFSGKIYRVFDSCPLPEGKIKDGTNFSQDSRGNWFLNIVIEVEDAPRRELSSGVGVDLGLKEFATLSNGEKIDAQRIYRKAERQLATAQRARKKRRVKAIHAKIAAQRRDFHHKLSTRLVREFDYIAVGNLNAAALAKTSMAKSVLDAGWYSFKQMLAYKSIRNGAWYDEVNEKYTSQTCSCCGAISASSPKGRAGLGIRLWVCAKCGAEHDRDVNAARNILARCGRASLEEGKAST